MISLAVEDLVLLAKLCPIRIAPWSGQIAAAASAALVTLEGQPKTPGVDLEEGLANLRHMAQIHAGSRP